MIRKKLLTAGIVLHIVTIVMTAASFILWWLRARQLFGSPDGPFQAPSGSTAFSAAFAIGALVCIADIVLLAHIRKGTAYGRQKISLLYASLVGDAFLAFFIFSLICLGSTAAYILGSMAAGAVLANAVLRCVCAANLKRSAAFPRAPALPAREKQLVLVTACMGLIAALLGVAMLCVLCLYSFPTLFLPSGQEPTSGRTDGDPFSMLFAVFTLICSVPTLFLMLVMSFAFISFLRRAGNGTAQLVLAILALCANGSILVFFPFVLLLNPTHILLYVVSILYFASAVAACVPGIVCGARAKRRPAPPAPLPQTNR